MNPVPAPVAAPPLNARPAYLQVRLLALVAVGGAVGTWGRAGLAQMIGREPGGWPWATLLVNLVGAFVLALMLEILGRFRRGHLALRLALGTGVMGGFTTYSAFAVETVDLLRTDQQVLAVVYVAISIIGGLMAALLGLRLGSLRQRPVRPRPQEDL